MTKSVEFGRGKKPEERYDATALRQRQRREATCRLCGSQDFAVWFYAVMDTMYGFLADTRELTPFGQGIRAAVGKLEETVLSVPEGIAFLTAIHERHFRELHDRFVHHDKDKDTNRR